MPTEFSDDQVDFFGRVADLPAPYPDLFRPSEDGSVHVPSPNPILGGLGIRFDYREIVIAVGAHTTVRYPSAEEAIAFILDVITDKLVFRFTSDGVEHLSASEIAGPSDATSTDQVWSGALKPKLLDDLWRWPPDIGPMGSA
jgi:hypothetical protein